MADAPEIQLYASEDDLNLMSDDESGKLDQATAIIYTTPSKQSKAPPEVDSDEELELRIKLLEEKKKLLKKEQLSRRIQELEAEVAVLSKPDEHKTKKEE